MTFPIIDNDKQEKCNMNFGSLAGLLTSIAVFGVMLVALSLAIRIGRLQDEVDYLMDRIKILSERQVNIDSYFSNEKTPEKGPSITKWREEKRASMKESPPYEQIRRSVFQSHP